MIPPDETLLEDMLLTTHALKLAKWAEPPIKTVGDLRKMSDAALLALEGCGKMALLEFRLLTGEVEPGQLMRRRPSDKVLKSKWLMAVAAGQCEHSFDDWKKIQDATGN